MNRIVFILVAVLSLTSCRSNSEPKTITIGNKYSLSVPSFMSEFDDLNKVASLQYGTSRREFFVIVIDESIKELEQELEIQNLTDAYPNNIQGHSKLLQQIFEKNYSVTRRSKILDTSINGMPTRTLTVEVNAEGTEVSFSLAYVYGKENFVSDRGLGLS